MLPDDVGAPPASDLLEVSLFGPGVGECVVVHLGLGEWMVVDSCLGESGRPIAVDYLNRLGVELSAVKLVVASHWHDDHIRGMRQLVKACGDAQFWCSAALGRTEWFAFVERYDRAMIALSSGVDEFRGVLQDLADAPSMAKHNTLVWKRRESLPGSIHALSPSSSAIQRGLRKLATAAATVQHAGETKRRVTELDGPNQVSIALMIAVGSRTVLLGADLEEQGSPGGGWSAILESRTRAWEEKADVFKVPHHGSSTGHHDGVWSDLVGGDAIAIVAPKFGGPVSLPTNADRERIRSLSGTSYITTNSPRRRRQRRRNEVERHLRQRDARLNQLIVGHVRLRAAASGGDWTAETFPPAAEL